MNRSNHTLFTWTARLFLATGLLCMSAVFGNAAHEKDDS